MIYYNMADHNASYGLPISGRARELDNVSILLVDDDKLMRTILHDALAQLGFSNILQATNGEKAIDLLHRESIDIVICDWVMHPMDGIALTRYIRSSKDMANRFVPIILTTGRSELQDVAHARDAGITEYLVKPFSIEGLCNRIISVVEKPRSFVMTKSFKGPDRRRRHKEHQGPERRQGNARRMRTDDAL